MNDFSLFCGGARIASAEKLWTQSDRLTNRRTAHGAELKNSFTAEVFLHVDRPILCEHVRFYETTYLLSMVLSPIHDVIISVTALGLTT